MSKIKKVVLTGGPCAGKSVLLEALKLEFGEDLLIIPEGATQLLEVPHEKGGVGIPGKDVEWSQEWQDKFEEKVIEKQLLDETLITQMANKRKKPTVIVCDRGLLDSAAYVSGGRASFLRKFNLDLKTCYRLYDQVIHLNSVATDRPEIYEQLKATNPNRLFESSARAKELDEKTFLAWKGHPNHIRVPAGEGIEHKMKITFSKIKKLFSSLNA